MAACPTGSWLGVDGGATHTTAALVDGSGRVVLWRGEAGPFNHLTGDAGVERMRAALAALAGGLAAADRTVTAGIAVAMTGATIPGKPELVRTLLAQVLPGTPVRITTDLAAAVWGAGGGSDAMILLCGTGSGAVALSGGRILRCGAHGSEFGDEGSAYAIAQAGVRAALMAADGRAARTLLGTRLAAAAGIEDIVALPRKAYAEQWSSGRVAALAPVVAEAARDGDAAAETVLADAGRALGDLAVAVWRRAGGGLRLSLMGGGWNLSQRLWQAAGARIEEGIGNRLEPAPPLADAAQGAALWALGGAPEGL